jgi:hypothetical protein
MDIILSSNLQVMPHDFREWVLPAMRWRRHNQLFRREMERLMLAVKVMITRYLGDDPQPGIVECEMYDAHGHRWIFVEKTAVVSADRLDANTEYPQPGVIAAEVVQDSQDATGRDIRRIDTERPWGVESVDGVTQFEVLPESLVEL